MSRFKGIELKSWKRKVDNKMRSFGDIDFRKGTIRVNKRMSKKNGRKRPINKGASKYPELLDTIAHEEMHRMHPDMTERSVRKITKRKMKSLTKKSKQKLYKLYGH